MLCYLRSEAVALRQATYGVRAGIHLGIGIDLPVVREPEISGWVDRAGRRPLQGVGPVARIRRYGISDFHAGGTFLGIDTAESADPGRELGGHARARRDGAKVEHPYGVVAINGYPPGKIDAAGGKGRTGIGLSILGLKQGDRWVGGRPEIRLRGARRIEPIGVRDPHVALAVERVADGMTENGLPFVCARERSCARTARGRGDAVGATWAAPCMRANLRPLDELLRQAFALLVLVTLAQDEARQIGYCVVAAPRR